MKKFFTKLLFLIIPSLIVFFTLIFLPPSPSFKKCLLYSLIDKNNLMATDSIPRIIFIGGSNLSFGLNCQMIKDSLKVNPINMGIHVGLGLKFMLSDAEDYIRESDIIIVSPEYQNFYGEIANGGIELLSTIIEVSPKSIKLLDYKQYYSLIQNIPEFLKSKWESKTTKSVSDTTIGIYDRKSFNSYGDVYTSWKLPKEKVVPFGKMEGKMNKNLLLSLEKFKNSVYKKKAKFFIAFPCYQDMSFANASGQIKEIEINLRKNGFNLLSAPERYIIPDSLIFNTPYHLTKQGTDLRTTLLIEDLRKVLSLPINDDPPACPGV
jgi:hypothetical protein